MAGAVRVIPCGFHLTPDKPISELYRLTPPRRQRSEIREALDAAHGIDNPADDDPIVVISPQQPWWRDLAARATSASRRVLGWAWGWPPPRWPWSSDP